MGEPIVEHPDSYCIAENLHLGGPRESPPPRVQISHGHLRGLLLGRESKGLEPVSKPQRIHACQICPTHPLSHPPEIHFTTPYLHRFVPPARALAGPPTMKNTLVKFRNLKTSNPPNLKEITLVKSRRAIPPTHTGNSFHAPHTDTDLSHSATVALLIFRE